MDPHTTRMLKELYRWNMTGQYVVLGVNEAYADIVSQTSVDGDHKSPNSYNCYWERFQLQKPGGIRAVAYDRAGNPYYTFAGASWVSRSQRFPARDNRNRVYNEALSKLNEKVRGGLDLSVDMAESKQTRAMLKELGTAERYFSGLGPKRWANEWLQLQYGWLPLLSTLYGVTEQMLNVQESFLTVKAAAREEESIRGVVDLGVTDISNSGHYTVSSPKMKGVGVSTHFCHFKVRLRERNYAENVSRWTSLNPASIMWELLPYSFVVDWVYDIGSYLRDLETSYLFGSAFRDGYVSEGRVLELQQSMDYADFSTVIPLYQVQIRKWSEKSDFNNGNLWRTTLASYPGPRLPTVNTDLSWRRWVSLSALLAQRLLRR